MKVTKKEQWTPILIELESLEELTCLSDIMNHFLVNSVGSYGHDFASGLISKLWIKR